MLTVSALAYATETVTLNYALETFTLADTLDVNKVAV